MVGWLAGDRHIAGRPFTEPTTTSRSLIAWASASSPGIRVTLPFR
jgi:hypothetical protein